MRNVIGSPARGGDFYKRTREIEKITNSLNSGNNIQITAPRRVGKTSILWYLLDNDVANRTYVYVDTESIANEEGFYKKLLTEVFQNKRISGSKKMMTELSAGSNKFFRKLKSIKIINSSIEFHQENADRNYLEELQNFLIGYSKTENNELVWLIDEFPQTIENIRASNEGDARLFLQNNRALRLNPSLQEKVKFIYTGSIGLNHTVAKLNATAFINDLNAIEVGPLNEEEATDLFIQLLNSNKRKCGIKAVKRMLEQIKWIIPFHIQLLIQEIINISKAGEEISEITVDLAINNLIDLRNQHHFDHYFSRLLTQFKGNDFKYADALLKEVAQNDSVSKAKLFDLSVPFDLGNNHRNIIHTLIYDGYITQKEDGTICFTSPLLKLWWIKFIS